MRYKRGLIPLLKQYGLMQEEAEEMGKDLMKLFERDGEKARSSELLARREADEGLGDHETGKASSDVSPPSEPRYKDDLERRIYENPDIIWSGGWD